MSANDTFKQPKVPDETSDKVAVAKMCARVEKTLAKALEECRTEVTKKVAESRAEVNKRVTEFVVGNRQEIDKKLEEMQQQVLKQMEVKLESQAKDVKILVYETVLGKSEEKPNVARERSRSPITSKGGGAASWGSGSSGGSRRGSFQRYGGGRAPSAPECYNCGGIGHFAGKCPSQ